MRSKKEICRDLWHSLDMAYVKVFLFWTTVSAAIMFLVMFFSSKGMNPQERWGVIGTMLAIIVLPILSFCVWRTCRIFHHPESYFFCKTLLSSPKGGSVRDSIRFTVVLEDPDGGKFVATTHSIFSTHKDLTGLGFEDYVNQTVTVAYNEETDVLVVIG